MPDIVDGATAPAVMTDGKDDEEEKTCPKCGATWTKTEPTLGQVRATVQEVMVDYRNQLRGEKDKKGKFIDRQARMGYRGSVATGKVGNTSKPHFGMEPDIRGECGTKYDIDALVISNKWGRVVRPDARGARWGDRNRVLRKMAKSIKKDLQAKPAMEHMKNEFSFRVWKTSESKRFSPYQPT